MKFLITKKELKTKYITEEKSANKIAKEYSCGTKTIKRRLKEFNITCPNKLRKKKISETCKKQRNTSSYKLKHGKIIKKRWEDKAYKNKMKIALKGWKHSDKSKLKMSLAKKGKKIPDKQRRKMLQHSYSQNKMEKQFENFLNIHCKNIYKYVGNGQIFINGFVPDFINKKEKKLIEFFGDYWHKNTKEKDKLRLKTYKKYGYNTLVVWQSEWKHNTKKVINKVKKFTYNLL